MKSARHAKILELIENNIVTTQDKLQSLLLDAGFETTQATISRDIRELRLVKTLSGSGVSYYAHPNANKSSGELLLDINSVFLESISSVERVDNFVVIKTFSGMANALCEVLDKGGWQGIAGTIAGDNTIFLLLRNNEFAEEFYQFLLGAVDRIKNK